MSTTPLRWGFLGAANIARKNWHAIAHTGNSQLIAVASRDTVRAEQFIQECQASVPVSHVPRALGSYDALLESQDIDAVYIPLPTGVRREWVIRAAEAKKHVVCEKPCATRYSDLREMTEACERNGVQFMDGVMFVHSLRMQRLREILQEGTALGELRRLTSQFSFFGDDQFVASNIRSRHELEPHGCLGDLGWYCLTLASEVFPGQRPLEVSGRVHAWIGDGVGRQGIPAEFSAELLYAGGVTASFYCSFRTENQQWASLSGSRGSLRIDDFVLPFFGCETGFELNAPEFHVHGCQFDMESHARRIPVREYSNNHPSAQETRLFREFADQVGTGRLRRDWPERALTVQLLMDRCLESALEGGRPMPID